MPLPDYPHRAMEDCKAAGFDYAALQKDNEWLKTLVGDQARVIRKLRERLESCVASFNYDIPGGGKQELTFKAAKDALNEEFGDPNAGKSQS